MNNYYYNGIRTNNLKSIDIAFNNNELVYIGGISGSGKSSLAFDTIAAISKDEYEKLFDDNKTISDYVIDDYGKVAPAAALRQLNYNVNPRSTIASYFGLFPYLAYILHQATGYNLNDYSPNGKFRCAECNGLGFVLKVDENRIIDNNITIKEGPFKCWKNANKDYFLQRLLQFCSKEGINTDKHFYELPEEQKQLLLYGTGKEKYKISFNVGGRKRTRTAVYVGPVTEIKQGKNDLLPKDKEQFMQQHICSECNGSRLNEAIGDAIITNGVNVRDFLTMDFSKVKSVLETICADKEDARTQRAKEILKNFLNNCKQLNLDYLSLYRSISSLSGGELQRLRMANILMGKLSSLLIVLDEPTGSLHPDEKDTVISYIKGLKKNHTILVVDYNSQLMELADRSFFLGPRGGSQGGYLIKEDVFSEEEKENLDVHKNLSDEAIRIPLESEYVKYGSDIELRLNTINGISGHSGIGKTVILRDILPHTIDNYRYISQKPLKGNWKSNVSTYTELMDDFKSFFSQETGVSKDVFSLTGKSVCKKCGGRGKIVIGDFYDETVYETCDACGGTGYSQMVLKHTVNNYNFYSFMQMSVDEMIAMGVKISPRGGKMLELLSRLGLGHLCLNQNIKTLSGGENQRIKLAASLSKGKVQIYGLDEPTRGLGKRDIQKVMNLLYEKTQEEKKTFIIVEHNQEVLDACSYNQILRRGEDNIVIISEK